MENRFRFRCVVRGEKVTRDVTNIDYDNLEITIKVAGFPEVRQLERIKAILSCTGFEDKNDTPIYEGDILRVIYNNSNYIAKVEYYSTGFMLVGNRNEYDWEEDFSKCGRMVLEILGNIYENPELLNNKQI